MTLHAGRPGPLARRNARPARKGGSRSWRAVLVSLKTTGLCLPLAMAGTDERVVVQVGERQLGPDAVLRAMQQLPEFQLRALGETPAEIRSAFLDNHLVPELLLGLEAERRKLPETAGYLARRDDVLMRALVAEVRSEVASKSPVTEAQARRYYERNRAQFVTPERIHLWRILVENAELARSIIEKTKRGQVPAWTKLAQEHSLDKATYLRNGDVGQVRPNGHTDVPRVRVSAELFSAAKRVADGELVPEPVKAGKHYAVLWRRGSLPEVRESFEQARGHIERMLMRERVAAQLEALLEQLRARHVRELAPELVTAVELDFGSSSSDGPRPAAPTTTTPVRGHAPRPGDDGLR